MIIRFLVSTGCRRGELIKILIEDIKDKKKGVFIRAGKGGKERNTVIFNDKQLWKDLQDYIKDRQSKGIKGKHLFLNNRNQNYKGGEAICRMIRQISERIAIALKSEDKDVGQFENKITCHTLRRTFAT